MTNILQKLKHQKVRKHLEECIPGNIHKDVTVLARRARLAMVQNLYDKGQITKAEALRQLNSRLSPRKPDTHFDDRDFLQLKENSDDSKKE